MQDFAGSFSIEKSSEKKFFRLWKRCSEELPKAHVEVLKRTGGKIREWTYGNFGRSPVGR
jgi:hypothetical protein